MSNVDIEQRPDAQHALFYTEAGQLFRHYATANSSMRITTIAQGFGFLTVAGFLSTNDYHLFAACAALFGTLATFVLVCLQRNVHEHCLAVLPLLIKLEQRMDSELPGPYTAWQASREKRFSHTPTRFIVVYGSGSVLILGLVVLMAYNVVIWLVTA